MKPAKRGQSPSGVGQGPNAIQEIITFGTLKTVAELVKAGERCVAENLRFVWPVPEENYRLSLWSKNRCSSPRCLPCSQHGRAYFWVDGESLAQFESQQGAL